MLKKVYVKNFPVSKYNILQSQEFWFLIIKTVYINSAAIITYPSEEPENRCGSVLR